MENNEKDLEIAKAEVVEENSANKKTKKKGKIKKIILTILCILLSFVLILGGLFVWYVNNKLGKIQYESGETTTIAPGQEFIDDEVIDFSEIGDATGNSLKELLKNWALNDGEKMYDKKVINILLIGSDASATEPGRVNVPDKGNTDVMMLVSINKNTKQIKLVSFMRDSYTYMDQFDKCAKLNAACANGGAPYLMATIENDYKIEIDGYALVDFDSFEEVINILGGVEVNVPSHVAKALSGKEAFPSGPSLLNGEQALRYCRIRKIDSDIKRVERQRDVITSLINKCKDASLSEINDVLDAILANVRTSVKKNDILSYATKAVTEGWAKYEISEITMPIEAARHEYMSKETAWIWVVDYPLAAQTLQLELYGKTNITLPDERVTAIDLVK